MKTSFRILAAGLAASLALVSCDKESLTKTETNETADGLRTITLSFANNGTKTDLGDNNTPFFVDGDIIKVAKSDGSAAPVDLDVTVIDNVATITTELKGELIAVYPSTAAKVEDNKITGVQVSTQQDGTFSSANICQATIPDVMNPTAVFLNQTAVFKITPKAGAGTKYVEVITAGPEIADVTGGSKPYDSKHKIHVNPTSAGPVYVSILVPSGLKIRDLSFADGTNMKVNMKTDFVEAGYLYTVSSDNWDYDYVELAGFKWATMNVGASSPTGYGLYFAWGDTVGQTWDGTKWSSGGFSTAPTLDPTNPKILPLEYDAANVNWGGSWRMPTEGEFAGLAALDPKKEGWDDTIKGYRFADANGDSIFLPAAGVGYYTFFELEGVNGHYWSSSLDSKGSNDAVGFVVGKGYINAVSHYNRFLAYSVRPLSE